MNSTLVAKKKKDKQTSVDALAGGGLQGFQEPRGRRAWENQGWGKNWPTPKELTGGEEKGAQRKITGQTKPSKVMVGGCRVGGTHVKDKIPEGEGPKQSDSGQKALEGDLQPLKLCNRG